jgi:hypothetical protein
VSYNYRTGEWALHQLGRASGDDVGPFGQPMLWGTTGKLYHHETGQDREGLAAFVESGPVELGEGERRVLVETLIPDVLEVSVPAGAFADGSEEADGDVFLTGSVGGGIVATFYTAEAPQTLETATQYNLAHQTDVRVSGRQFRLKLSEIPSVGNLADGSVPADNTVRASGPMTGTNFRIGNFRLSVISQGRR